ncbi:hypothetical protein DEU56DRAFT_791606 [Suillus clintonianus]|uniref:uncharacterized protein n=1 Tax=Suillus clintonianus TaxID=1904413 RepID=UPI001B87E3D5|nr:uncharacterized protein DEU56DRAFT_791606 [Suillus clintonianus]KAG2143621.1 hypothetical protein DEU56DRAFT_791606 [Suillus clintonianus]
MSGSYVLLQFGSNLFSHRFEDLESRPAFTVKTVDQQVNVIVHIAREAAWSQQHPEIMGPSNSYLYFGPSRAPGYLVYGNGPEVTMANHLRHKKDASTSRYFTAQNGKELKWKVFPQKMECIDGRSTIATWELSQPEDVFSARLTIKHSGLSMVTEILTTLCLNRMALDLEWKL